MISSGTTVVGLCLFAILLKKIRSFSTLSDADAARFNISASEKADFMEEITTELSVYFGMLYHMVEIFKGHDDFADELSEKPC